MDIWVQVGLDRYRPCHWDLVSTAFDDRYNKPDRSYIFFQFSLEVLTNHKFLNIWLILANLFAGYGLVFLWNLRFLKVVFLGKIAAIVLAFLVTVGGVIDLFPIHNSFWVSVVYSNDRLIDWLTQNTDPKAIFLSERYVNHAILASGRKLFYGHPYYAWSAGYDTGTHDAVYREMLESKDIAKVFRLLKQNNISYVAIDNSIRKGEGFIKNSNESVLSTYFQTAFSDDDHRYDDLRILQVPDALPEGAPTVEIAPEISVTNAFDVRTGDAAGSLSRPRGITTDSQGFFYVSDTDNARVQKFDADGKFVGAIGTAGSFEGELKEPNGVAVDQSGYIYVTDSRNHKLIKFTPDGKFVNEWKGPDAGFYGPRDIALGPNKQLYVVDQGRTRVARFDPETESFSPVWGTPGGAEAQFNEPTGIAIGDGLVFVVDFGNSRIQIFDLEGRFVRQFDVAVWEKASGQYPDAVFDEQAHRLYVTSGRTNEVLSFDLNGNRLDNIAMPGGERLDNPSAVSILEANKRRWLLILNTGSSKVSRFELEPPKGK